MARQDGDVYLYGTMGWANGYIGTDGRGVIRRKGEGMTGRELRNGKSELRRIWTGRFGTATERVKEWWRWVPEGMRGLGDRYASQRMIGMLMPSKRWEEMSAWGLSGMNLSRDAVTGSGLRVDVMGEDRDFYARSWLLPEGFVVRGMASEGGCFPWVKEGKLRARVHVHVGCLGRQVQWDENGELLPVVHYDHVSEWVELDAVASLCKVRLDWKGILRGRKVGDVVVLLGIEVGYLRGSHVVRIKCGSRLWVAWAGALDKVRVRVRNRVRVRARVRASVRVGVRVADRVRVGMKVGERRRVGGGSRDGPG